MRFAHHQSVKDQKFMDLVPIVNVVLLLVFFFLLSWSFVLQPGVEVRLPSTPFSSATPQGRHVVTLKMSGSDVLYFFDEKSVSVEDLMDALRKAAEQNRGDWITLTSDESVSHGRVTQIATEIMQLGFHVTEATQQSQSSSSPITPATP
jgi:biopolymer transport protein ExbD